MTRSGLLAALILSAASSITNAEDFWGFDTNGNVLIVETYPGGGFFTGSGPAFSQRPYGPPSTNTGMWFNSHYQWNQVYQYGYRDASGYRYGQRRQVIADRPATQWRRTEKKAIKTKKPAVARAFTPPPKLPGQP